MKPFVVVALTTLLSTVIGPAAEAIEQERDAVERDMRNVQASVPARRSRQTDPAAIAKLVDDINAAVRKNKQRMLSIIVINTDIAASQLEREKTETRLTFGDVYE